MKFFNSYIVLEGADGVGKTTLAKELAKALDAVFMYEPCGETKVTKQLRELALQKEYKEEVNAEAREYIMLANRAVSTERVKKILGEGETIVQDRSAISGMVYANVASEYSFAAWWSIAYKAFKILPDIVVYVKTDKQNIAITEGDIYDDEKESFHTCIKNTFPQVVEWFEKNQGIKNYTFTNDFTATPKENAQRLIVELTNFQKKFDTK